MNKDNIIDLLDKLGKKYKINQSKPYIQTQCFWFWNHYREDRNPSFSIRIDDNKKSYCRCFGCHSESISLFDAVTEFNNRSSGEYDEIVQFVRENDKPDYSNYIQNLTKKYLSNETHHKKNIEKKDVDIIDESELDIFLNYYSPYLKERGISEESFKRWELKVDRVNKRIVFPFRREKDLALVGATGRIIDQFSNGTESKYYAYWNFNKSKFFYGEHLFSKHSRYIVLTEGQFDVVRLDQLFRDNDKRYSFFAISGSILSDIQCHKLRKKGLPVILLFDGDKYGKKCTNSVKKQLKKHLLVYECSMPDGYDPGDIKLDFYNLETILDSKKIAI